MRSPCRSIAFSNIRDLLRSNGTIKPPGEWDPNAAAAVAAFRCVERPATFDNLADGNPVEYVINIRLHDKLSALDKVARHLGLSDRKPENDRMHEIETMSDAELDALIEELEDEARLVHGKD